MKRSSRTLVFLAVATKFIVLSSQTAGAGNVIFFHPDGTGAGQWAALRIHKVGPDGELNWDRLPGIAVYTGHVKDSIVPSSNSGATAHAYGVKVARNSFGLDGGAPIISASGMPMSVAEEAMASGKSVGLVQTGQIAEPGTAAFVASVKSRAEREEIARQVIESGAQVIMAGGERYMLPAGVEGRHGAGVREDNLNLIARAKELGYEIVYTRDELAALDLSNIHKLLGVFASVHTFQPRESTRGWFNWLGNLIRPMFSWLFGEGELPAHETYLPTAPTVAEMAVASLEILVRNKAGFLLVIEEEATDNLANRLEIDSLLEALSRADDAIGAMLRFVKGRDDTLLLVAADSNAAGLQVIQGDDFLAQGSEDDTRLPFSIGWVDGGGDVLGGVLVRTAGLNADQLPPLMDNTDIYKLIRRTLFDEPAEAGYSTSGADAIKSGDGRRRKDSPTR